MTGGRGGVRSTDGLTSTAHFIKRRFLIIVKIDMLSDEVEWWKWASGKSHMLAARFEEIRYCIQQEGGDLNRLSAENE